VLHAVPSGHAHRFRDIFAVKMLLAGIPLERLDIVRASKREDYKLCERKKEIEDDVRRMWQETEKSREQTTRPSQAL
jgi:hypothetical protein